jgi:serine/threonine protein kinase
MGEVYRARDTRLGRDVALKILPAAFASDPDRVRRFEQEGRAAAALNHPNIVVIYDAGSQDGVFYVATELLEGETLRERLATHALPVRKAIDYAIQIARGLAVAHAKGITHRDLKPENLFLTKDGLVKILDFGLAKHSVTKPANAHPTELATQPIETNPGMVLGTAGYMSPEQVRGQVADERSDLFSLGVVLYEMVSGKRAFTGESGVEVMNAILKQEPPDLDAALPPSLDRMIRRCLEKKPEERFQSALDLAFALESISGTTSSGTQRIPEKPRRRYAWMIALVAGARVAALAFVAGRRTSRPLLPSFQRLTFRRGFIDNGRFANGGKTILYSASWEGNPFRIYSTQTESPESRDLVSNCINKRTNVSWLHEPTGSD